MNKPIPDVLPFAKMQALGNDFIIVDGVRLLETATSSRLLADWEHILPSLAVQICSRRFGVGADGLVLILDLKEKPLLALARRIYGDQVDNYELAWTFTNNDGSAAEICGNALRCLGLWGHAKGLFDKSAIVLTAVGPVPISYTNQDEITVDLGIPRLTARDIPFQGSIQDQPVVNNVVEIGENRLSITCVNLGNPHCLVFPDPLSQIVQVDLPFASERQLNHLPQTLSSLAEMIQADARFPKGVNVSFIISHDIDSAKAVVWERGCGPTMACGSAAAAILVGGVLSGRLKRAATITLPGGSLLVSWSEEDKHVRICGEARLVCEGTFFLEADLFNALTGAAPSGVAHR